MTGNQTSAKDGGTSVSKRQLLMELDQVVSFEFGRLLKEAPPNRDKTHRLAKTIQQEALSGNPAIESIRDQVVAYYATPFSRRDAIHFHKVFGFKPYPWLQNQFCLNFANAEMSDTQINRLSSKFRFFLAKMIQPPEDLLQPPVLHLTLFKITHPRCDQKNSGLDLRDFRNMWERVAHKKWGERFQSFFKWFDEDLDEKPVFNWPCPQNPMGSIDCHSGSDLGLTQTDLDWMKDLLKALHYNRTLPKYPLSQGPTKRSTRQLEKVTRAFNVHRATEKASLLGYATKSLCTTYLKMYGQFPSSE